MREPLVSSEQHFNNYQISMVEYTKMVARIVFATLLLLFSGNIQAADETTTSSEPNTYWDKGTDNHTKHTLTRRMALVGHNCMVSRLADGIKVGSGSAHLRAHPIN